MRKNGEIKHAFFRNKYGISCDLAIFSKKEATRLGRGNWPEYAGLTQFSAFAIRQATKEKTKSDVFHDPDKKLKNYSHSVISPGTLSERETKNLISNTRILIAPKYLTPMIIIQGN
jgi:hypothetical protein